MSNYRRSRIPGGSYFFTVNLLNRTQSLLVDRIDVLRSALRNVQGAHPFEIDAIVILPDHLHCIWTLPPGDDQYSMRWRRIKTLFSSSIETTDSISDSRKKKGERGIWQRRFWEHTLRDDADYAQHVDYIHYNPVKHGFVAKPIDWQHSSLHQFVKCGILKAGWGTDGITFDPDLE